MVSALRLRTKSESKIDRLIHKFSEETKREYYGDVYTTSIEGKSFVDKSVQKLAVDSIIEGYFPKENLVKDMAIKRVNNTLCIALSLIIAVVVISYYFVISCEIKLNDLSRQTVILNNENEELQNKLDTLKSFNNVDQTMEKSNTLQRAGHVIEAQEVKIEPISSNKNKSKKRIFNYPIGF